ncbi:hypothetical protein ACFQ7F_15870 [Streptomyces sp. NPDC056486]|uniref:hypothetical protein n=1 Tax=Streptomyces sp. NPDC056486 TaxID=3345835 RepID=UPI0036C3D046
MAPTPFPNDLIELQTAWTRTYEALSAPRPVHPARLRRTLQQLSTRLMWHPYWSTEAGRSPAARVELRRLACAREEGHTS